MEGTNSDVLAGVREGEMSDVVEFLFGGTVGPACTNGGERRGVCQEFWEVGLGARRADSGARVIPWTVTLDNA